MTEGTAKERQDAAGRLYEKRARAIKERPESPEDGETKRMLGQINSMLEQEFKRLGLVDSAGESIYIPVKIEEVQGVGRVDKGDAGDMVYDDQLDIIQYELGQKSVQKFVGLLHEGLHTTQAAEFAPMWKSRGASAPDAVLVRGGYMTGEAYEGGSPSFWKWCNEAVVHSKTLDLVSWNATALTDAFPGTAEDDWLGQHKDMYGGSMRLLGLVVDRFAADSGVSAEAMRDEFFRRHVTGDTSHLEKLNEFFGEGATEKFMRVRYDALDKDFDGAIQGLGI